MLLELFIEFNSKLSCLRLVLGVYSFYDSLLIQKAVSAIIKGTINLYKLVFIWNYDCTFCLVKIIDVSIN